MLNHNNAAAVLVVVVIAIEIDVVVRTRLLQKGRVGFKCLSGEHKMPGSLAHVAQEEMHGKSATHFTTSTAEPASFAAATPSRIQRDLLHARWVQ